MANGSTIWTYNWLQDEQEVAQAALDGLTLSNHSYGTVNGWGGYIERDEGRLRTWYGDVSISDTEDYRFGLLHGPFQNLGSDCCFGANPEHREGPPEMTEVQTRTIRPEPTTSMTARIGLTQSSPPKQMAGRVDSTLCPEMPQPQKTSSWLDPSKRSRMATRIQAKSSPTADRHGVRQTTVELKPDFVSQGASGFSTASTSDTAYGTYSGTSMATPSVTGSIGLIHEQRARLGGRCATEFHHPRAAGAHGR